MKVAVFLESYNGKTVKAGLEAATAAKAMGGDEYIAVVLGKDLDATIADAGKIGFGKVYKAEIDPYNPSVFAKAIASVEADYYVLPGTVWGREIGPRLAVKFDAAYAGDITKVVDAKTFVRSIHGNKILSTIQVDAPKVVVTVRPGVFDTPEFGEGNAEVNDISVEADEVDQKAMLTEVLAASTDKIELTEADIIVSGGRGVGGPENFKLIEELADVLGAAVGASRAVVDAGWRPHSEQVGQTGKFVSPKLYIAVGISGAIQHLAGMSTSDIIVAINKDEEAPIFKVADYGIVADLFKAVPKLIEKIKEVKSQ